MCQFDIRTWILGRYPLVPDPSYGLSGQTHLTTLGHDPLDPPDNMVYTGNALPGAYLCLFYIYHRFILNIENKTGLIFDVRISNIYSTLRSP